MQDIAFDLALLQKTRQIPVKKIRLEDDEFEIFEMQHLKKVSQKNDDKLEMLKLNTQMLESNIALEQLKAENLSEKRAYEALIVQLQANNKANNEKMHKKENEIQRLTLDIKKLNTNLDKLKMESKNLCMSKEQKIKALNMVEKNYKDRFNQEKLAMQKSLDDFNKTVLKLKSDLVNASSNLEAKTKLLENLKQESNNKDLQIGSLMKQSAKYEEAEIQIKILQSQISVLETDSKANNFGSHNIGNIFESYSQLQKENSDLKSAIILSNSKIDQNYLLVTEIERIRHQIDSCQKICNIDYPKLKHQFDINCKELEEWQLLAKTFIHLQDTKPSDKFKNSEPRIFFGILEDLSKSNKMLTSNNEKLNSKVENMRTQLLSVNAQLSKTKGESMKIKSSHDNALGNLKNLRDKLLSLKPKSDKLQHYLENRSIIPKGHSEFQNFLEVFTILQDIFGLPLCNDSSTNQEI